MQFVRRITSGYNLKHHQYQKVFESEKDMSNRHRYSVAVIAALTILISYLHYSTVVSIHALHGIYAELYYIPVLLGALFFGLSGGIGAFIFVLVLYLPYVFLNLTGTLLSERLLALFFIGMFAVLTGAFIDRERRYRKQLERDRYLMGLGQAATMIVHDLKNPLFTIIGFAKRIMEKKENDDTAVEAIIESAEVMQKIVFDVLDFAKPIVLEVKAQDIRDIVKKSCEACKLKAADNGTSLTLELPSQSVIAEVDGFRVERALSNLINNAIEASGKGQHVRISMSIEKTHLLIIIQDNGAGMDRETLENIFIPYYTKKSAGSGLGMPIAKKIIEGHKGKILIDSKPGRGTKVGVYLPKVSSSENTDST